MRHYMLTSLNSWLLALRASLLHVLTERRSGLAAGLGAAAAAEVKEPQRKEPQNEVLILQLLRIHSGSLCSCCYVQTSCQPFILLSKHSLRASSQQFDADDHACLDAAQQNAYRTVSSSFLTQKHK